MNIQINTLVAKFPEIASEITNYQLWATERKADGNYHPKDWVRKSDGKYYPSSFTRKADGNYSPANYTRKADGSYRA